MFNSSKSFFASSSSSHPTLAFVKKSIKDFRIDISKKGLGVPPAPKTRSIYDVHAGGIHLDSSNNLKFISESKNPRYDVSTTGRLRRVDKQQQQQQQKQQLEYVPNPVHRCSSNLSPISRTAPNRSLWELYRVPMETFEGNAKDHWIDGDRGWCYVCQEPVGTTVGNHIGMRDHANMCVFLYLYSLYPRHWSAREVMADALVRYPDVSSVVFGFPYGGVDHLHTMCDIERRKELEAMLLHLTKPPHHAITHSLTQPTPQALWVSGERMFKINVGRLVATMTPPMAAGVHTSFTQKCWSRSNLERMYDLLNIARIHDAHGIKPKEGKLDKAFFMRTMLWELHVAKDGGRDVDAMITRQNAELLSPATTDSGSGTNETPISTSQRNMPTSRIATLGEPLPFPTTTIYEDQYVTQVLVEEFLRRFSFELIHLQTMEYMNRAQDLVVKCEFPGWNKLAELDAL